MTGRKEIRLLVSEFPQTNNVSKRSSVNGSCACSFGYSFFSFAQAPLNTMIQQLESEDA